MSRYPKPPPYDLQLNNPVSMLGNRTGSKIQRSLGGGLFTKSFIRPKENLGSIKISIIVVSIILIMEIALLAVLHYCKIIDPTISTKELMPVISALVIASLIIPFLPRLKQFKLPGSIEAEMKPPELRRPEIPIFPGPTGEVGFGSLLPTITSGPLGIGGKMNWPAPTDEP